MSESRLTGLEFYWFSKGKLLATRYQYGEPMNLDELTAALAASVSEDARQSFAGAESLRRVAARFVRDADGIGTLPHEPAPLPFNRVHADRRTKALRGLAANFESAADAVVAWKRRGRERPCPGATANDP
jgi:hypothetical protein